MNEPILYNAKFPKYPFTWRTYMRIKTTIKKDVG